MLYYTALIILTSFFFPLDCDLLKESGWTKFTSTLQAPGNHSSLPSLPLLFHPQLVQESTQKAQRGNYIHKSSGLKGWGKTSDLKSKHHQSVPQTKSRRKCGSPPTHHTHPARFWHNKHWRMKSKGWRILSSMSLLWEFWPVLSIFVQ